MVTAAPCAGIRRVLIIEDQLEARDSLRVLLSIHGCDVRVASDAREAVRQTVGWRPEVVISDIGLPDLDGWELGKQMRAGLGDKTFFVAVTGHGHPSDMQRSREAGFDAHLTKPADLKALLRLIGM
jgi:DNA-binding response OmpR family regulator